MEIIYTNPETPALKRATEGSAGYDLYAMINEPLMLQPGEKSVLIPSGIKIHMQNPNICAKVLPRSGNGHKKGLVLGNGIGLIDSDFTGEIMISVCVRPGHDVLTINPGDKIAQLVFVPVYHPDYFETVTEFSKDSARGEGGFGSTGN